MGFLFLSLVSQIGWVSLKRLATLAHMLFSGRDPSAFHLEEAWAVSLC